MKNSSAMLPSGSHACKCAKERHDPKLVVLTGGPGGGKTALLEMARRYFCPHVAILPEAATIIFSGGFPRLATPAARRAAQRAIFQVQRELESIALQDHRTAVVLCDRGTLDGAAYWPGTHQTFFEQFNIRHQEEMARYAGVIHMEVPALSGGYEHNAIRRESAKQARLTDRRIAQVWSKHPNRMTVGTEAGFLDKLAAGIELIRSQVPLCCQTHLHATVKPRKG